MSIVLKKRPKVILMMWRGCIGNVNCGLLPNAYLRHGHSQPVTKPRLLPDRQFFFTPTVLIIAPLFCIRLFKLFISGSIKRDDSKPYYPILGHTCYDLNILEPRDHKSNQLRLESFVIVRLMHSNDWLTRVCYELSSVLIVKCWVCLCLAVWLCLFGK